MSMPYVKLDLTYRRKRPHGSLPLDSSDSNLKSRVSELESKVRQLQQRLALASRTNSILQAQLAQMKELNKSLVTVSDSNGDSRHLIQKLLITEAKQQLSDAKTEISKFRQEAERQKTRAWKSKGDTKKLEGVIKQYRKMLSNEIVRRNSAPSYPKEELIKKAPRVPRLNINSRVSSCLDFTNALLFQAQIKSIFKRLSAALKQAAGCSACTIFIMDKDLQKEYSAGSKRQPARVVVGSAWVLMHTGKKADYRPPLFKKPEDLGRGVIGASHIVYPVSIRSSLIAIVQCEGFEGPIEQIDDLLVKLVLGSFVQAVAFHHTKTAETKMELLIDRTAICMQLIAASRTHQSFSNAVFDSFPGLFGYQSASVVYFSQKSGFFYVNVDANSDSQRFGHGLLKFPATIGLCGATLSSKSPQVYHRIKELPSYCHEVDNQGGLKFIEEALMAPLCFNEQTVGILVLANKTGGLVKDDTAMLAGISKVLGSFIVGLNDTVEAMELTVRIKECTAALSDNIQGSLGVPSAELADLGEVLTVMCARMRGIDARLNK